MEERGERRVNTAEGGGERLYRPSRKYFRLVSFPAHVERDRSFFFPAGSGGVEKQQIKTEGPKPRLFKVKKKEPFFVSFM